MLPGDIATRVKRQFGDESGVQITDADIIRWINDAQNEAVMQMPDLLMAEVLIEVDAETQDYYVLVEGESEPLDIREVSYRESDTEPYYPLTYMTNQEMNDYVPGWDGSKHFGTPTIWTRGILHHQTALTQRTVIALYPVPPASIVNALKVTVSRPPIDVEILTSKIDLPGYLHPYILEYCLMKAYELDEEWEAADRKAQYVQSTIDANAHRDSWTSKDVYPSITSYSGDM